MDADLIERLAREAGINVSLYRMGAASLVFSGDANAPVAGVARDQFERFAAAVAEECAVLCDELREHYAGLKDVALLNGDIELSNASSGEPRACEAVAAAIRGKFKA